MSGMKSAQLPRSAAFTLGDAMAKTKLDRSRKKKSVMSVTKAQRRGFPTTHWANAVAMLRVMKTPVPPDIDEPLPEDFSASDFDIIRARGRSGQI